MPRNRNSLTKFEVLMVLSLTVLVQLDVCRCTPSHRSRHHADMSYEDTMSFRSGEELPRPAALNSNDDPLIVQTRKGKVRGKTMTATTGKEVDAWFGIPYAQKPLGKYFSLLFKATRGTSKKDYYFRCCRIPEVSASKASGTLVGYIERHHVAQQLRADSGHRVR